ncbi:MAG: redoxin family protein [Lachnospiraceae bacterium]|nr:redoxin family protein [Lachnospiraceae bacterium]
MSKNNSGSPKTCASRKMQELRPGKRRIIQLYAALLYNANLKGFGEGTIYTGPLKNLCVPGLNCYSCPGAIGACPLGALQNALASSTTRFPAYVLGILILFGLLLGRTICGFLCPFGLVQELLHKIPSPKIQKGRITRILSYVKYGILLVLVLGVPLYFSLKYMPVPAFCKTICPAGTLEGALTLLSHPANRDKLALLGPLFTRKVIVLAVILVLSVLMYRPFCRILCPLGAIYGFFCRLALVGVKLDKDKCVDCGLCLRHCHMDIRHVGDHECISCGDCIDLCPTGAITLQAGKAVLRQKACDLNRASEGSTSPAETDARADLKGKRPLIKRASGKAKIGRILLWILPAVLLAGLLLWVNADPISREKDEQTESADVPVGYEVGMKLPDFSVPVFESEEAYNTADHRGQYLLINFWATWCGPCVKELPCFEQLTEDMGEQISVIAIHSSLVTEDVEAWIQREGYDLTFGYDESGEVLESLGGSAMLPMTVITDSKGIIVYNKVGSVSTEILTEILTNAGLENYGTN